MFAFVSRGRQRSHSITVGVAHDRFVQQQGPVLAPTRLAGVSVASVASVASTASTVSRQEEEREIDPEKLKQKAERDMGSISASLIQFSP